MKINSITKNLYIKFLNPKINSSNNNENINLKKEKENRTFWESIQKLKPLVK